MKYILVVDDDPAACDLLKEIFLDQGWAVKTAQTPQKALNLAEQQSFDLVVSDINLESDATGLDLLNKLCGKCPVILITAFGSLETAVEASKSGAWDFISKPFKVDAVVTAARRALYNTQAKDQLNKQLPLYSQYENNGLLGHSQAMIEIYKQIARIAPTRSTVLIMGESGTGKELVAKAIHKHSQRAEKPFIVVNCGALTESLLESELFGHTKGSFTGATTDHKGLWEEANGGTLFLDEIGEMSLSMQVKLLRALQEGEVRRVGSAHTVKVDARILAATNRDLEKEVKNNLFREDLFYRLSVVTINIPPLRDRQSDIAFIADHFLKVSSSNLDRNLKFSDKTLEIITSYSWPGNVRELGSAIEYAALNAKGNEIEPEDLPQRIQNSDDKQHFPSSSLQNLYIDFPSLDELEHRYLLHVLEMVKGNKTRAAEILKIDRRTLYRMAERFRVKLDN